VGAAVSAAAALQSAAIPGTVLVGPATHAATEGIFEWGPTTDVAVTGVAQPLAATYLVRPRARSGAEAARRRLAARAPIVGREAELALLSDAVRATVAGRGGAVMVVGEPGLGKTRLVVECRKYFMGWVGAASGRLPLWLEGRCASYASSTPYGAYQQLLAGFIGAPLEAGEPVLRPALEAAMRAVLGKGKEPVALLARLLGLPPGADGAYLARMGSAELQHETFAAVRTVLTNLLSHGPTVLALEDLHWADPTSLRLTADLATLVASGPLLVLGTRRPEPDPGVGELEAELAADPSRALKTLRLAPIQKREERALARSLLGAGTDDEVLKLACEGVEGNPLFLEERVASLLDTGALQREDDQWRANRPKVSPVPEALERLIRSRADRLSPAAREAIVAASILGEEAEPQAIGAVSELVAELDGALAELVSAGLLTEARGQPEPLYRFRHALIRDATYHGLLRSQRRQLHTRAAWHMEVNAGDRLAEVAGVLGRHFAAAGEKDRAAHYLELAGDHADQIFANDEAIALYSQALAVIGAGQDESGEREPTVVARRSATAARLYEKLTDILTLVDRYDEARSAARAGLGMVPHDETLQAARLQCLLGRVELQAGNYDAVIAAHDASEELIGAPGLDDGQEVVDLWLYLQLQDRLDIYAQRGELERCAAFIERARPLAEARATGGIAATFYAALAFQHLRECRHRFDSEIVTEMRRAMEAWWVPEPPTLGFMRAERGRITLMCYYGVALTWSGDLDGARQVHEQTLIRVEREGSPGARGAVLVEMAITEFRRGDVHAVRELLPEAKAAAATRGDPYHTVAAKGLETWVAWRDGRLDEALRLGVEALERWGPGPEFHPYCLALFPVADAYLATGQTEQAVGTARRLLEPAHAALPDELEASVRTGCDAWDRGEADKAGKLLGEAVLLARDLGYA
jgi:tetratricopeptide (TPR) repeat protein